MRLGYIWEADGSLVGVLAASAADLEYCKRNADVLLKDHMG